MRIKIVTFHNAHNFGAVLQCYALKKTVQVKFGKNCEVYDIQNYKICQDYRPTPICLKLNAKILVASTIRHITQKKRYRKFTKFINEYILTDNKNEHLSKNDELYICGSDQIWNYSLTDFDKRYFLDFVENENMKNAYSASFGFDSIPEDYVEEYKSLLSTFNKISVREQQAAKILKDLLNIDVPVTLDPSLLLDKKEWSSIASKGKEKNEYILMYLMDENDTIINFARYLKGITGHDIIYICDDVIHRKKGIKYKSFIGPEEWVSLFLNAKYVVTNSFHGLAFSINFNKDFFVGLLPPPSKVNSRLENIINLFNLEDRMIVNGENKNIHKSINYEKINEILMAERKKSIDYLKSVLEDNNE